MQQQDDQCTDKIRSVGKPRTEGARPGLAPNMTNLASLSEKRNNVERPTQTHAYAPLSDSLLAKPMLPLERAPLSFPLTRHLPKPFQFLGMLCYSLLMALSVMALSLSILNHPGASSFVNIDGSVNGLAILLASTAVFLLVPACSLLCGVLFGSWCGMCVSVLAVGSGMLMTHLANPLFWSDQPFRNALPLIGFPIAAFVVGLIYEHRTSTVWWKSALTLTLGAAIVSLWLVFFSILLTLHSAKFVDAMLASAHPQDFVTELWVGGIILALLGIVALTLPSFGVERLLHWQVTTRRRFF